jgi:hypothetical protein
MPGFKDGEDAIRARLVSTWERPEALVFQNESSVVPDAPFVLVAIVGENERIAAFGGGPGRHEWEVDGRIEAYVCVPVFSGLALARAIRDDFAEIFRGQRFSGVSCLGVTPMGDPYRPDKGNVYTVTAVVDFTYRFKG